MKKKEQTPEREDFENALQEHGTFVDISVDELVQIHKAATRHARMRAQDKVLINKLMTTSVTTVSADCTLSDAAHLLVTEKISGLPVVDENNCLIGIITEADFLHALGIPSHQPGNSLWHTLEHLFSHTDKVGDTDGTVSDLMQKKVITVSPDNSLHEALASMKHNAIKRLVVCDDNRHVVGMLTRSDIVRIFFDHFIQ